MTIEDHMKAAWEALLRGDHAARDRHCELAKGMILRDGATVLGEREALRRRVESVLGDGRVICDVCGANLGSFARLCKHPFIIAVDRQAEAVIKPAGCPGFRAIEDAALNARPGA